MLCWELVIPQQCKILWHLYHPKRLDLLGAGAGSEQTLKICQIFNLIFLISRPKMSSYNLPHLRST